MWFFLIPIFIALLSFTCTYLNDYFNCRFIQNYTSNIDLYQAVSRQTDELLHMEPSIKFNLDGNVNSKRYTVPVLMSNLTEQKRNNILTALKYTQSQIETTEKFILKEKPKADDDIIFGMDETSGIKKLYIDKGNHSYGNISCLEQQYAKTSVKKYIRSPNLSTYENIKHFQIFKVFDKYFKFDNWKFTLTKELESHGTVGYHIFLKKPVKLEGINIYWVSITDIEITLYVRPEWVHKFFSIF